MSVALLDIIDSNLQLWNGQTPVQSPGYALLDGKNYRFGKPAREAARLRPRDINTRYWWQLSTEALQPAMGPARHTADLVHAHLENLQAEGGQPGEMILAVPGSMQRDQLSLLLGIVQQCPFDAVGLVNRSVALASAYGATTGTFHLEIQLHQAAISELEENAGKVELTRTVPLPGCGLLQLQERLVEIIAAAFIRQTRFDPRRKAATEQQLYDALPGALRALAGTAETNIEVNGYRARIDVAELKEAGQRLFEGIDQAMGSGSSAQQLLADPLAGLLPGLAERFPQLEMLDSDALFNAIEQHGDILVLREQALSLVTSLPSLSPIVASEVIAPATQQASETAAPANPEPTHLLLHGGRAQRLDTSETTLASGWALFRAEQGWQLTGTGPAITVNGREHNPDNPLTCGDRIHIAPDREFQLIEAH